MVGVQMHAMGQGRVACSVPGRAEILGCAWLGMLKNNHIVAVESARQSKFITDSNVAHGHFQAPGHITMGWQGCQPATSR